MTPGQARGLERYRRIHLIGIGGAGMSAIARVLLGLGHVVTGSDLRASATLDALRGAGATAFVGHAAEQVQGADLVAMTSAAPPNNPEVLEARRLGLPLWSRAEMLRALTAGRRCVAVAGTHGKTTTTAMITVLLRAAGLDPSYIVGGETPELDGNGYAGQGRHFVVEADEYDYTFLALQPAVAVVTNVEWDHVDCYPDLEAVRQAFAEFIASVPDDGRVLLCRDDPGAWSLPRPAVPVLGYGLSPEAAWRAADVIAEPHGTVFFLLGEGQSLGRFRLGLPGEHNVRNALAALAVAAGEGVALAQVREVLADFGGVRRRFQQLGIAGGVVVVDDYAHHPTEVRATLEAARQRFPGRRLVVAFQPHTYSRTLAFAEAFGQALARSDVVLVTGIYAARERDPGNVSGAQIAAQVRASRGDDPGEGLVAYVDSLDAARDWLSQHVGPGDVLLTLGAGDITGLGPQVLATLDAQREGGHGYS